MVIIIIIIMINDLEIDESVYDEAPRGSHLVFELTFQPRCSNCNQDAYYFNGHSCFICIKCDAWLESISEFPYYEKEPDRPSLCCNYKEFLQKTLKTSN